jgi:hypothetical protein
MSSFSGDIRISKQRHRGRLVVRAVDQIDERDLAAAAEKTQLLSGAEGDLEEVKQSLVREAILDRVRRDAPEVFAPGASATLKIVSDYDVEV